MSNKKKSFILHIDSLDILDDLTVNQSGLLFKAIKAYQNYEQIEIDDIVKLVFSPFKNQFIRDDEKYTQTCERRAIAGAKGGKQKVANASKCKQKVANVADSDSKNKNDSKSNSEVTKDIVVNTPKFNFKKELLALGVDKEVLKDWLTVRKNKKASNTKTALKDVLSEITKSGLTVNDAVYYAAKKSWSGFRAKWYLNEENKPNQGTRADIDLDDRSWADNFKLRVKE